MPGSLREVPLTGPLEHALADGPGMGPRLFWLGQAGFVLDIARKRLVIDPYLSDTLAIKYRGARHPHERMMPPPVAPENLTGVDYVLCSHAHTDHMDPGTLPALFAANPAARLVAPRAARTAALERSGLDPARIDLVAAGETIALAETLRLTPTRAAHETLERDAEGNHRFLGYAIAGADTVVWHSGDTVAYDGQAEEVARLRPDIALLPVNGRRPELSENGVPGNLSLGEAVDLARAVGASAMVAHHYGLFAFNTADPDEIDRMAQATAEPAILRARQATALEWAASEVVPPGRGML
jgi:L-ascorbate metabolism protein UlaG (beta-lactamase superfamily)